ncbi:hypothetical protein [Nitratiruptor tergarcus]|uniref:Uncharacterized protein n=1 Tax=Nitratiruptor tergarcus DSM 16512 TaxID=1069081 RepID=A0A1W1WQQ3_9BACT|nr:hypothetical protein [Nitratiruptor tergarcus]SMC08634.1 hypothetical protein SAMN05660197_0391 [Nitratiruptor tergarcus DSM 16512]
MRQQGFSLLEKQILALHYNGSYITNFEFQQLAQEIGIDLDLADREKMLKTLLKKAMEENKMVQLIAAFTKLLNSRIQEYTTLANRYPYAQDIIGSYIQKTRATLMLLQQRARMNPYE